ncbi:prepilin-type cleavage/methylation N-terminal domain protein [Fusobacterium gonidiaformans 3-1-5R]|uniref:Prepilin-type cleavage/methylation N-terminal domain protein n=2 Tax=Fusobacterium TaxID=848 RepID=E5BIN3_9FUSO|nr:hypothetical protein C4N16_01590 [Fusobacterium gonidiaformans ATCC 25563]EFS22356.1 prepilin-type cleavage/methylation N-terminal domain protein [Fusobacterium gonidiaformans 3-1-5R]
MYFKSIFMKRKGFILLEISCSIVLFLLAFLSFFSLQKRMLSFLWLREKQYDKKWEQRNAIISFQAKIQKERMEEGDFYYNNAKWSLDNMNSKFLLKVSKEHLRNGDKEEDIYYFQMFDIESSKKIWEGWSIVIPK